MRTSMIASILCRLACLNIVQASQKAPAAAVHDAVARTDSLSTLLHYILANNCHGCAVIIIHDGSLYDQHSGLLSGLCKDSPAVSFLQQYVDVLQNKAPRITLSDKCFHYLIFVQNIYNLNKIIPKETVNKVIVVAESTSWTIQEYLKTISSRSYTNLLVITHSLSRRTEQGSYLLYTHELYTDGSGSSLPVLLTSWIKNHTSKQDINLFPEKLRGGFKGHRLLISTANQPPFAIRKNIISQQRSVWDGIDIRMIRLLGATLNFTADFRDAIATNSSIYAVMEDVLNEQVSAAVGGIYRTDDVIIKFDNTVSHMEDCAAFISLSSLALPKYRAVMGPFQPGVWVLVCLVYFIAIIPLCMNTNYTLWSLIIHPSRFLDMFWFVFSTFTNSFVVKNPLLDTGLAKNSTSLLIGIYWVFTIIITSCYTGSIMAFITVPAFPAAINSAEQLLEEGYDIGTLGEISSSFCNLIFFFFTL
uniref:Ionotropic receptor 21a n=1 Tax=Aulacocentrum confusum TaxID=2767324 RepID=A0A7G8Z9I9_9HYME|nr:ionotropic receptor 21a [Aulacocentrum confusum]